MSTVNIKAKYPINFQVVDTMDLQRMDTTELIIRHYKEQSEERVGSYLFLICVSFYLPVCHS